MKWIIITLLFFTIPGVAQDIRCKWISDLGQPIQIDSLSLVPGSFKLSTPAEILYDIDLNTVSIQPNDNADSVQICYSVFPFNFSQSVSRRNLQNILVEPPVQTVSSLEREQQIKKSGILSRGVNMGNRQDMSVDSRMDLRLEGNITEDLYLKANIFDQNIPYQPEGNTNSLKNFDRLNLEVFNDKFSIEAGDIILSEKDYSFLRYRRGVMGVGLALQDSTQKVSLKTGINKGKFHSHSFKGQEGISGPYRIDGPTSDSFIIVLAGSESLYLDGKLLERGKDYVIDYNLGEITFQPTIMITSFSRIRIDFEYMNRSFQRSARSFNYELVKNNVRVYTGYFSESDNTRVQNSFSQEELELMAGFSGTNNSLNSMTPVTFSAQNVSYILVDSLENENILMYSKDSTVQHYSANFTYVGEGNGNYVKDYSSLNAALYKWIAPENGIPNGNYEPVRILSPPMKKEIFTIGSSVGINDHEEVFSEAAFSSYSQNTLKINLSPVYGIALKTGLKSTGRQIKAFPEYTVAADISLEWIDENYRQADPFRGVDFNRDWGLNQDAQLAKEWIWQVSSSILNKNLEGFSWHGKIRNREDQLSGWNSELQYTVKNKNLWIDSRWYTMRNQLIHSNGQWNTFSTDISVPLGWIRPGYSFSSERNVARYNISNAIESSLQYFDEHRWYLVNTVDTKTDFTLSYALREDRIPEGDLMKARYTSTTLSARIRRSIAPGSLELIMNNRQLRDTEASNTETIMGAFSGNLKFLKGGIQTTFRVNTQSGWEPRREYVYIEVPSGQGFYAWRDLNSDGIQQIDEFFEAVNIDERNYIRYFVNTPERLQAHDNSAEWFLRLKWPTDKPGSILNKLHGIIRYDLRGKTSEGEWASRWQALSSSLDNVSILSGKRKSKYRLYAADLFEIWNIETGLIRIENKNWVQNGFELRNTNQFDIVSTIKINPSLHWKVMHDEEWKNNSSDVLSNRNYSFNKDAFGSSFEIRPGNKWSVETGYQFKKSEGGNSEETVESAMHLIQLETRWSIGEKRSLSLLADFADVLYKGNPNSALAYDLMEAFLPGENLRMTCSFQQELNSGLLINLIYNGRKSALGPWVNRASLRLSARF